LIEKNNTIDTSSISRALFTRPRFEVLARLRPQNTVYFTAQPADDSRQHFYVFKRGGEVDKARPQRKSSADVCIRQKDLAASLEPYQ